MQEQFQDIAIRLNSLVGHDHLFVTLEVSALIWAMALDKDLQEDMNDIIKMVRCEHAIDRRMN